MAANCTHSLSGLTESERVEARERKTKRQKEIVWKRVVNQREEKNDQQSQRCAFLCAPNTRVLSANPLVFRILSNYVRVSACVCDVCVLLMHTQSTVFKSKLVSLVLLCLYVLVFNV